jgi:hypothetical protein
MSEVEIVAWLKPLDIFVRGTADMNYLLGTGEMMPVLECRDRAAVVAVLRFWADRLEA